jgi:hypothetical protein
MRLFRWLTALLAVTFAAYLWLAPGYVEIEIPVAKHTGGWGFWWESHRTQLAHIDQPGVLYVHRQLAQPPTRITGKAKPRYSRTSTNSCANAAGRWALPA